MQRSWQIRCLLAAICAASMAASAAMASNRPKFLPKGPSNAPLAELSGVTLNEKLGAPLPLQTPFVNSQGQRVILGEVLGHRPVILTFNYSNCPLLCSLQLDGLVDSMQEMEWSVGQNFDVVTISLDHRESTDQAAATKARYIEKYGRPSGAAGWHFLTGTEADIKTVADAVGFGFRYHPERKEYLHPAVLTLVSPRGNVSTYISGVKYDATVVRDRLIVAGTGEISAALTAFLLSCYHYEAPTGTGAVVTKIMRYGGFIFVFGFVAAMAIYRLKRGQLNARYRSREF